MEFEFLLYLSKSWGLFYLLTLFIVVVVYALWPSNKSRFDKAASSIIDDQDKPCR